MLKLFAVFRNELTKTFHKKFIYIIYTLLLLGLLGIGLIYKVISSSTDQGMKQNSFAEQQADIENDLINLKQNINSLNSSIAEQAAEDDHFLAHKDTMSELYELNSLTYEKILLELALKHQVNLYNYDYLTDSLNQMRDLIIMQKSQKQSSDPASDDIPFAKEFFAEYANVLENPYADLSAQEIEQQLMLYQKIVAERNYASYIESKIAQVKIDKTKSDLQKQYSISDLELDLKVNPDGLQDYKGMQDIRNRQNKRDDLLFQLEHGYDAQYKPLSNTELKAAKRDFTFSLQSLEECMTYFNFSFSGAATALSLMITFATFAMVFILIILGGSTISQEISSGSIKGLIIAPVRRSKIFVAKLLNLLFVSLLSVLIAYLFTLLSSGLFFPTIFHFSISGIRYSLYLFLFYLGKFSLIFLAGCIALMFSATTTNTSIAVGITMIIHFGLAGIYNFFKLINQEIHAVLAFLPFEYFDLSEHYFQPFSEQNFSFFIDGIRRGFTLLTPAYLPILYWSIMLIAMIWTAHNAFINKDI